MATQINLPPSFNGYVTSSLLSQLGLSQTTTPGGGTGYQDAQGNVYTFNGSSFVPLSAAAGGSSNTTTPQTSNSSTPSTSNAPQTTSAPAASSGTSSPSGGNSIVVGGAQYNLVGSVNGQPGPYYADSSGKLYTYANGSMQASNMQNSSYAFTPSAQTGTQANPNSSVTNLGNLGPGSTGSNVTALQSWLVQNGYLTQAQMDTGPGIYGPQTTAAVAAWQKSAGIDTQGNPGYFGPISQQYLGQSNGSYSNGVYTAGSSSSSGTSSGSGNIPGTSIASTGNANLDSILGSLSNLISTGKATIPAGLQITPQLTQQFLAWAHQVVDPQTQQLISAESAGINSAIQNQVVQYQTQQGEDVQQFGQNLAANDNSNAAGGTAFSGLRNVQDQNLANSTNRTLASLDANTNYNISNALQTGGAALGSANAGSLTVPTLNSASVGVTGGNLSGSQGSSQGGQTLDFSYNPSIYTAGTIPSSQSTAVSNLAGNYLSQYGTLAGANSGQSISQLIGGVTGLPSNYQVPSNLT